MEVFLAAMSPFSCGESNVHFFEGTSNDSYPQTRRVSGDLRRQLFDSDRFVSFSYAFVPLPHCIQCGQSTLRWQAMTPFCPDATTRRASGHVFADARDNTAEISTIYDVREFKLLRCCRIQRCNAFDVPTPRVLSTFFGVESAA